MLFVEEHKRVENDRIPSIIALLIMIGENGIIKSTQLYLLSSENYTMFNSFCKAFPNVSRETIDKIQMYLDLLRKWNQTHNLLQKEALVIDEFERRHLIDCWQLTAYIPKGVSILDVGSGNGLPGILLSLAGYKVEMTEKDRKKVSFLKYCVSELDLTVVIKCVDVYCYKSAHPILTSRAFSSLGNLLSIQENVSRETIGYFLKGQNVNQEIEEAKLKWFFNITCHPSLSSKDGVILVVSDVVRKI